jgi:hypothetical protein
MEEKKVLCRAHSRGWSWWRVLPVIWALRLLRIGDRLWFAPTVLVMALRDRLLAD